MHTHTTRPRRSQCSYDSQDVISSSHDVAGCCFGRGLINATFTDWPFSIDKSGPINRRDIWHLMRYMHCNRRTPEFMWSKASCDSKQRRGVLCIMKSFDSWHGRLILDHVWTQFISAGLRNGLTSYGTETSSYSRDTEPLWAFAECVRLDDVEISNIFECKSRDYILRLFFGCEHREDWFCYTTNNTLTKLDRRWWSS